MFESRQVSVLYSRIIVAGERSGCGKTAISLAVMNALSCRGIKVQGFKTGPDYIDTSHYETRTGRKGRNIDLWMTAPNDSFELFRHNAPAGGISVIEGVMGLYDGAYPDNTASTAHTAKFLRAPVILVLDSSKSPNSAAATALGFKMFDPEVNIAGFILNRVPSPRGAQTAAREITRKTGVPVLGFMPVEGELAIGSRHLGLVHAAESPVRREVLSTEAAVAEKFLDIDSIEKIARSAPRDGWAEERDSDSLYPRIPKPQRVRLAIAYDKAFSFYYENTLDLFSLWGCETAFFSPLSDESLPEGSDAVFLGGGFPELYCPELEENVPMRDSLRRFAEGGGAVYGECGGMMYLGASITDLNGRRFGMCSVLPADFEMRPKLQSLGYREVCATKDSGFFRSGDRERGHEFHYSTLSGGHTGGFFEITKSAGDRSRGGIDFRNTTASYIHLNFLSSGLVKLLPQRIKPETEGAI